VIGLELLAVLVGLAGDLDRGRGAKRNGLRRGRRTIEVATPPLSMSSSVFWIDQCVSGGLLRPIRSMAASQLGGTT
jgi:hypothetical protein